MNGNHNVGAFFALAVAIVGMGQLPLAFLAQWLGHPEAVPFPSWTQFSGNAAQVTAWSLGLFFGNKILNGNGNGTAPVSAASPTPPVIQV